MNVSRLPQLYQESLRAIDWFSQLPLKFWVVSLLKPPKTVDWHPWIPEISAAISHFSALSHIPITNTYNQHTNMHYTITLHPTDNFSITQNPIYMQFSLLPFVQTPQQIGQTSLYFKSSNSYHLVTIYMPHIEKLQMKYKIPTHLTRPSLCPSSSPRH